MKVCQNKGFSGKSTEVMRLAPQVVNGQYYFN